MTVETNVVSGLTWASSLRRRVSEPGTLGARSEQITAFDSTFHMSLTPHGSRRPRADTHHLDGAVSRARPTGDFLHKHCLKGPL